MNKQISAVALLSLVLLGSLIVATTYWQTWATAGLAARDDNSLERVAQLQINRGYIYAADAETVLAANTRRKVGGRTLFFRVYPTHGFASQAIGYSTENRSRVGLEQAQNAYLTGANQDLRTIVETFGDRLKGTTVKGNNIVLNLRVNAQRVAESLLAGKCGAAVALNPKTGAVLAMASAPTYDPNLVERPNGYAKIQATEAPCSPSAPLLNRATQGLYPPGSTFKAITAAAALDSKLYTPESTFYDPGYCTVYGKKVYNAGDVNHEVFGNVTFVEAFQHSINAVFCDIGKKLGAGKILETAKKFGFYSVPPLETPSDARSPSGLYTQKTRKTLYPKDPDNAVDAGRLAFGQERMLVTPLQMAMAAGAIANGGVMMKPRLVNRILSRSGSVIIKTRPQVLATPTSLKTAAAIRDMMVLAVDAGTGGNAAIPGVSVAGKTGTAETSVDGVYHAWFIFFAPADDPIVAGAVVVESQPNGFGGAIAAPIAKAIMQAILPGTSKANS